MEREFEERVPAEGSLGLFDAVGIELEYMVVDAALRVRPVVDAVLRKGGSHDGATLVHEDFVWSNELARHVIEVKTNGPVASPAGLATKLHAELAWMQALLAEDGLRLLPGGMHPWMVPEREFELWPHDPEGIYGALDRVFDCHGHGWSNLQSMHLNVPFRGDEEFGRLHAAVRVVLPLLPGLAASSPFVEGKACASLDHRLEVYGTNAAHLVPELAGPIIPEPIGTRAAYESMLQSLYRALAPHDPEGILQNEWINGRAAIARFDRSAIEIRVIDTQEGPRADLSVAALVLGLLRLLVDERWVPMHELERWPAYRLAEHYRGAVRLGSQAEVRDERYLQAFGLSGSASVREIWLHVFDALPDPAGVDAEWLEAYRTRGTLAERLRVDAAGAQESAAREAGAREDPSGTPDAARLRVTYERLAGCLANDAVF